MSQNTALEDGHHLARGAVVNTITVAAANLRGIFEFLIARLLGEAAFGRYGLAWSGTELLSKVGVLGFDNSMVAILAPHVVCGDRDGARRLFHRAVWASGVVSAVLVVAGIAAAVWIPSVGAMDVVAGGGALMLLALPGIAIARIAATASRSVMSMRNEFYSRSLVETWTTIAVFLVAYAAGWANQAAALAVVAGTGAAAVVAVILAERALARAPASPRAVDAVAEAPPVPEPLAGMIRFSLPVAGTNLLNVLLTQADILLLGLYVGRAPGLTPEAFGAYCAASRIAIGIRKVRQIFDPIFAPIVARRAAADDRQRIRETVAGPARWLLSAQLPYIGALIIAGSAILSIYGPGFRTAAMWLVLLALAHGTNLFAGLVETLLMIERPDLNLLNAMVTVVLQVGAALILIPQSGATGAALATCIGFAAQGVLRFVELKHVYGWSWPWSALARPVTAFMVAFVTAGFVRLISPSTILAEVGSGLLFLGLYVATWWWMGPDPSDRAIWSSLLNARRLPKA